MCEHGYRLGEDWRHLFSASEHQNPAGRRSPDGVLPWRCDLLTDESRSDGILPIGSGSSMATHAFSARAPVNGYKGWFADDGSENGGDTYESVTCLACNQLHTVNPRTGRVLGADEETN